jgi:hypothetical protein
MAIFNWAGTISSDWSNAANWLVNGVAPSAAPGTLDSVSDGQPNIAIINTGTVASLSIGTGSVPGGHVLVSGSLNSGTIDVTSLNGLDALIGGLGAVITAPSLTMGPGSIIGGSGTFNISSITNNGGVILANGGSGPLGELVITGGTVSGTGNFTIDGASTLEVNTTTSETIFVNHPTTTPAAIIFDQPSGFTGTLELNDAHNHLNLFFHGQTITTATFDGATNSLLVTATSAGNTVQDTIKLLALAGPEPVSVGVSALGEVTIGTTILPNIPAPDASGISTTTMSSTDLSTLLQGDQSALRFVAGTEAITLVDGTLSVGPDTDEAFVERLYLGLLVRAPDQAGLSNWINLLNHGGNKTDVGDDFVNSEESAVRHVGDDDPTFVSSLYSSMLGRPADDAGLNSWTGALANPATTRGDVVAAFADSAEAKLHFASVTSNGIFAFDPNAAIVREDYSAALGRDADTGGLANWMAFLNGGGTAAQLIQAFAGSAEFQARHASQTNPQYVDDLYQSALGRPADPNGEANWVAALQSNTLSRTDVLGAFAQSQEAVQHLQWPLT